VRRNHPRVGGMELVIQPFTAEEIVNVADAVSYHQGRAILAFGDKVPEKVVDRAGHPDRLPLLRHQGERSINGADSLGLATADPIAGLLNAHVVDPVVLGSGEIDEAFNIPVLDRRMIHEKWLLAAENDGWKSDG